MILKLRSKTNRNSNTEPFNCTSTQSPKYMLAQYVSLLVSICICLGLGTETTRSRLTPDSVATNTAGNVLLKNTAGCVGTISATDHPTSCQNCIYFTKSVTGKCTEVSLKMSSGVTFTLCWNIVWSIVRIWIHAETLHPESFLLMLQLYVPKVQFSVVVFLCCALFRHKQTLHRWRKYPVLVAGH